MASPTAFGQPNTDPAMEDGMMRHVRGLTCHLGLCLGAMALAALPSAAQTSPQTPTTPPPGSIATVILKSTTTGDGAPLVYPTGTPEITARHVIFPPGSATPLHRHPIPLFAYMLEGELTITTEGQAPRIYKAGDAFMETSGWHVGRNLTDKPARLLSVYSGAVGIPLSETHK